MGPIPEKKWFMEPSVIVMGGGILPFGSIFIEMYFIFTSFWAYKIYYVYGFMLLVFLILLTVTVCVTIVCTYFLLNADTTDGNGQPSCQLDPQLDMSTSTLSTTFSSKQKCMAFSKQPSILDTWQFS